VPFEDDDLFEDEIEAKKFGPIAILVTLILILALLTTLIWPLLRYGLPRQPTPTPTPAIHKYAVVYREA
jgi:flagellar biogenesis protein FliO